MPGRRLVFIHGFLEDATMWKPIIPQLTKKDYKVSTPELPGHGNNAQVVDGRIEAYCDNILEQLQLASDETIFIVGHSFGGYIAANLASKIPNQIRGMCLFHSKAGGDNAAKIVERQRAIEAALANKSLYVRTMLTGTFAANNVERCRDHLEELIRKAENISSESIVRAQEAMIARPDWVNDLKERGFSLYYFLGEQDKSLPVDILMEETRQLPGAVAEVIPGIGHMGHIERHSEAVEFIQRILRADY